MVQEVSATQPAGGEPPTWGAQIPSPQLPHAPPRLPHEGRARVVVVLDVDVVEVVDAGTGHPGWAVAFSTPQSADVSADTVPPAAPPKLTQYVAPSLIARMKPPSELGFPGTTL